MIELNLAALSAAEALINRALTHDPASRAALKSLAGKVLHFELSQPSFNLYLCPREDKVDLQAHCEMPVSCKVTGRWKDLLALADGEGFNLAGSGVTVLGQTNALLNLRNIVRNLEIDWEDWLASYIGDELANPVAKNIRSIAGYLQVQGRKVKDNIEPYLSEEVALIPTKLGLENFASDVADLNQNVERFEAKLQALARKIKEKNSPA